VSSGRRRAERELVASRVAEADPDLAADHVMGAIDAVAVNGAALGVLARALAEGPDALRAGAPPAVGRLVVELRRRGSRLGEPACARCGRTDGKLTASNEGGVCPMCRRRQMAAACIVCRIVKPVASRDPLGRALCARCAPRPQRVCSACGRLRIVARRAGDGHGDICDLCFREPLAICRVCRRQRPCHFVAERRPVCLPCSPRRSSRCAHCGQDRPASVRWPEGPVCEPCYRAALSRLGTCAGCGHQRRLVAPPGPQARLCSECAGAGGLATCKTCGAEERPFRHGDCVRCALAVRAGQLIGDIDGPLRAVYEAIAAAPQPYSAHNWLRSSKAAAILAEIATGDLPVTHEALDAQPNSRAADYLRHVLVANGVLGPRDDALVRLEAWAAARLATIDDRARRRVLRSYATWRVLRRARHRAQPNPAARTPTRHAKTYLNTAIAFLEFLHDRGRELSECTQADIDAWINDGPPSAPALSDFLDWAATRKHMQRFAVPGPPRREGPALDDDTRWAIARRLLHDDTLELGDRVAGCLVLLYGQQLSRIVTLTRDQVAVTDNTTRLQLGDTHIDIPEPLDQLVARLANTRRPYTGVGSPTVTPWLFPGLDPGRPLTAYRLGQRLQHIDINPAAGRRAALTDLAAHLPAAVLARVLNISPNTAVRWVRTAGGDWTTYAAQIIHDRDREP
jgi:hypothetical protein